jgi:hypothetical protein
MRVPGAAVERVRVHGAALCAARARQQGDGTDLLRGALQQHTARQWISRLVRRSLSFSKKLQNYIGAIWYFVHRYNLSLLK